MKQYVGTVGAKGQVTLPIEVRRQLGIKPKDRVVIEVEDGSAVVRRSQSKLSEGYRSIHAVIPGRTDEEMTRLAEREAARAAAREGLNDD